MVEQAFLDAEALNRVPYGACVTDSENRIVFWNRGAEALVGHRREDAAGARCYDVIECRAVGGSAPLCAKGKGCPADGSSQDLGAAAAPGFFDAELICASGRGKSVTFVPLPQCPDAFGASVALKLFSEREAKEDASASDSREIAGRCASLTPRETEVVQMLADGFETADIARELFVSVHTVLNHIRNARAKLKARNRLDLVVEAAREGLLEKGG